MSDRTLLENAARAASFINDETDGSDEHRLHKAMDGSFYVVDANGWRDWTPLTDDGDALRLAVKLRITPMQVDGTNDSHGDFVNATAYSSDGDLIDIYEDHLDDPYAATRLAIVRAAAAIGEGLK